MEPKCGEGTCLFWGGQSWYHLPLPVRCLHKFFSREAEKRQVLSSPRLSLAKYWFEYRSTAQRASLQQIYVFLKPGRVGVIEAKYGSNMETGDGVFISLPATRDCKKPLFNQALPLLGEGEQVWWKEIKCLWNIPFCKSSARIASLVHPKHLKREIAFKWIQN